MDGEGWQVSKAVREKAGTQEGQIEGWGRADLGLSPSSASWLWVLG